MASKEYRQQYRKQYWKQNKQVSFVISSEDYAHILQRAKRYGNTVGQQLWQESQAYQKGEYLPPNTVEERLDVIIRILRGIGNNINQIAHHSNRFRRLVMQKQIFESLENLERDAGRLIRSAWKPTDKV